MSLSTSRRGFLQSITAAAAFSRGALAQAVTSALRSPYLQDVRKNRATVCWTWPEPGDASVEYWDDSRAVRSARAVLRSQSAGRYQYEAVLNGLSSGTSYGYRALMGGARVGISRFETPGTAAFEFLAFGDSGTGSDMQGKLARRMLAHPASFVVHTGDLVYPAGTLERYENLYFAYYEELMQYAPFFPCPGNHDYYEDRCIPYRALHSLPSETVKAEDRGRYYSFDWGNAHFVSLDSNDSLFQAVYGSGDMLRWLDADLAASQKFWRIAVVHHPAYASGVHNEGAEGKLVREHISPILAKHGVPLVLNGHEHSYQRSVPIRSTSYVTTGGGGAILHAVTPSPQIEKSASEHHYLSLSISGSRLKLRALREDSSEIDTWDLAPPPSIDAVVDAASFSAELASGGLVSIFGHHLAADEGTPPPGMVTVNGKDIKVLMASPSQINLRLPEITGEAILRVNGPNGVASLKLDIAAIAPAIFEGVILRADGTAVSDEFPAQPGETLSVYATGTGSAVEVEWNTTLIAAKCVQALDIQGVTMVIFEAPAERFTEARIRLRAAGKRSNTIRVPGKALL